MWLTVISLFQGPIRSSNTGNVIRMNAEVVIFFKSMISVVGGSPGTKNAKEKRLTTSRKAKIRGMSQDTLPSPLAIGCLTKYYYSYCTTSDVHGTPVSTTVNTTIDTAVTIVFSNTVRAVHIL